MYLVRLLLAVVVLVCSSAGQREVDKETKSCSMPWFVWQNNSCKCGSSLGSIVTCQEDPVHIQLESCYCMTVNILTGGTVVGACPYTCAHQEQWYSNETELNHYVCSEVWKRTGQLCSQCIEGYGPPVYSYSMQCVPCSPRDSILLFLALFLPLTVFCLIIITLRISVARPPLSTFILVSQVMTSPQYLSLAFVPEIPESYASSYVSNSQREMCWKIFASFFGLWNLDIFRSFYPPMCLSPYMSNLQVKFLEFIIALYPLAILLVTYFSINLYHGRGYKIIFCLCKPVIFCLARLRQAIDIKVSLVDAFATFIILSVIKVGYTSVIILQRVYLFAPNGNYTTKVYTDPSFVYFGKDHLPYALTALVLTFVLIFIPLLLLFLYPLRSFQKFLNNRQWQCSILHIFADTFQGCYKNGTNGTRDHRWFAGLHLILRFILVVIYNESHYEKAILMLMIMTISLYVTLLMVCQPYKKNLHLKLDVILLFGLLLWSISLQAYVFGYDGPKIFAFSFHLTLLILGTLVSFLYIVGIVFYWGIVVKRLHLRIMIKLMAVIRCNHHISYLLDF